VVQRSGFVSARADIDQAVEDARGVKGARSVKLGMRSNGRQIDPEA